MTLVSVVLMLACGALVGLLAQYRAAPPDLPAAANVGVPGDPRIYYADAASGGIFKTSDGGVNWQAIFDDQPVASIDRR